MQSRSEALFVARPALISAICSEFHLVATRRQQSQYCLSQAGDIQILVAYESQTLRKINAQNRRDADARDDRFYLDYRIVSGIQKDQNIEDTDLVMIALYSGQE
jgi:hypothetical protein